MGQSRSFVDQLKTEITINYPPARIISLVPSQTELLYDLGLESRVVGITKFCIHPHHWIKEKKIIGGTKNFWFDAIHDLKPDLIIGNKEENYKEGIEELRKKHPVWMSDILDFHYALEMIRLIGQLTNTEQNALRLSGNINASFEQLKTQPRKKVLYLIWRKPWMGAGSQTFIHAMLERLGFINCLESQPRYPELSVEEIKALNPELIFLSSEPYPFQEKHRDELKTITQAQTVLVDGEMFSWYGSRLVKAPAYFNSLVV